MHCDMLKIQDSVAIDEKLNSNIPNFVTAPHVKIFPHNPPDQKFHMNLNDQPRVSLLIFDTLLFKCAI